MEPTNRIWMTTALMVLCGWMLPVGGTTAQGVDPGVYSMAMYGVGRTDGTLRRFDFSTQEATVVGTIRDSSGTTMTGIDATAYIPGFQNIFGFWTNPADDRNKLVYINTETAYAAVMADDLEGGRFTGAAAVGPIQDSAMHFDGVGDFIELPHSDAYLLDSGTIMFWFRTDDASRAQGLFSKDSKGYDTGGHVHISIEDAQVQVRLQNTSTSKFVCSGPTVQANTWHHLAFTFGSGGMKLFLDGVQVDSDPYTGGLGTTSGGTGNHEPIVLGANQWNSGDLVANNLQDYFCGDLSGLGIVDHALGATDLTKHTMGRTSWTVFAVQHAKTSPPVEISGLVNLNPNNSPHSEFTLVKADGQEITRDDLHDSSPVDGDGTFYEGDGVTMIRVKPKGNGDQNDLVIDGEPFNLQNSNTYIFSGEMSVRVFNDQIHSNGKAMGHWWVQIISGTIVLDNLVTVPHRLVQVDQKTGVVTEVMPLERPYDSLASRDGLVFYGTSGNDLYEIDPVNETETFVGPAPGADTQSLEFAGVDVMAFESGNDLVYPLSTSTGQAVGSPADLGIADAGSIVFVPLSQDPANMADSFD